MDEIINQTAYALSYTVVKFRSTLFKGLRVQGGALQSEQSQRHNKAVRSCFNNPVVKFCSRFFKRLVGFGAKPRKNFTLKKSCGCPNRKRFDAAPCEASVSDGTLKLSVYVLITP